MVVAMVRPENRRIVLILGVVLLWPLVFYVLMKAAPGLGMIWLLAFQLYYLPFGSWLREPFFTSDSELSFTVLPLGMGLAAICYAAFVLAVVLFMRRSKEKKPPRLG
jgi:hypothetical protein